MSSICEACQGQCCQKLPSQTAIAIIHEVVGRDSELGNLTCRGIDRKPDNTAICAFWNEDDGCALEPEERPSICNEFECDLYQIASADPNMIPHCIENGRPEFADLWHSPVWLVHCQPGCPYTERCRVPVKTIDHQGGDTDDRELQ